MTEITRVPLQPIGKGSIGKLWLGIAAAVLLAGGVAWAAMPVGVRVVELKPGTGGSPTKDDYVLINYKGTLPDGKVFDQHERAAFGLNDVVPGFAKALTEMHKGGSYRATIPAELAYGDKATGPVPPNTDLTFEVDLLDYKSKAEVEQQMQMMQQLQQMQQMQGAAPNGAPGAMPPPMPEGAPPPR